MDEGFWIFWPMSHCRFQQFCHRSTWENNQKNVNGDEDLALDIESRLQQRCLTNHPKWDWNLKLTKISEMLVNATHTRHN